VGGHREGVSTGKLVSRDKEVCDRENTMLAKGVSVLNKAEGECGVVSGGHVASGSQGGEGAGDVIAEVAAGDECVPDAGLEG
jgi:hypothetical protein